MIDRRTLLGGFGCLAASLGLAGCGGNGSNTAGGADDVPVSWVSCRISSPRAVDPLLVADRAGLQVLHAVFSPLTRLEDGRALGLAARSFEVSEDARSVTFRLVPGALFHNGEVVTATSYKRAWERLVRPLPQGEHASRPDDAPSHSRWCSLLRDVEGYEALYDGRASELVGLRCPDDETLVVTLVRPHAGFAALCAHPALGPVPSCAEDDPEGFAAKPIGNGVFKFRGPWKAEGDIRLARFDDCAYGSARSQGALLAVHEDTVASYNQFQAGLLDVCDVPAAEYDGAQKTAGLSSDIAHMKPGERMVHGPEAALTCLVCNTRKPPFNRIEFRRALSYAIDRETLCKKALNRSAEPAFGPIPSCLPDAPAWEVCGMDAERSIELVDALKAEEPEATADSMGSDDTGAVELEQPVEPIKLDFTLLARKGGVQARIATHIAEDAEAAGIIVRTGLVTQEDFAERCREAAFDCGLVTIDPAVPTAESLVMSLCGPGSACGSWTGLDDTELSDLVDKILSTPDECSRTELIGEALAHLERDLAVIPLVHPAYSMVASERVSSARVDARGVLDIGSVELI